MHRPCHLRTQESSSFMQQGPWVMARLKKDAGKLTRHLKEVLSQCPCCAWGPWISWKLVPGDRAKGRVNMDSTSSTWYQKAKEGGQSHEWSPSHLTLPQPQPKPQSINPHPGETPEVGKPQPALGHQTTGQVPTAPTRIPTRDRFHSKALPTSLSPLHKVKQSPDWRCYGPVLQVGMWCPETQVVPKLTQPAKSQAGGRKTSTRAAQQPPTAVASGDARPLTHS